MYALRFIFVFDRVNDFEINEKLNNSLHYIFKIGQFSWKKTQIIIVILLCYIFFLVYPIVSRYQQL